eukprot:s1787_g2.t1
MSPTLERRLSRSTQGTSSSVALRWSAGDSMSSTPPSLPPSLTQSAQSWRVLAPGPCPARPAGCICQPF